MKDKKINEHEVEPTVTADNDSPQSKTDEQNGQQEQQNNTNEAYVRLLAEFENFKKRMQKEQQYWLKHIKKDLLLQLLPVLDDFSLALQHKENAVISDDQQGVALIHKKLMQILANQGLKTMEVNAGDLFDTNNHEALSTLSHEDQTKKDTIAQVVHPGYLLDDEVIRFAKVIVRA